MNFSDDGQLLVTLADGEPGDRFIAGLRYAPNGALRVTTALPAGTEPSIGGWRRTHEGIAFVEVTA